MKHQMQNTEEYPDASRWISRHRRRQIRPGLVALCILLAFAMIAAGCGKSRNADTVVSPAARDASLRQIAADYARAGDLAQAQAALDQLKLANPTQLLVSLAETDASAGRNAAEIVPMARLAEALGARSAKLIAYLEPTATTVPPTPGPSPIPPSPTAAATAAAPTATSTAELPGPPRRTDICWGSRLKSPATTDGPAARKLW